MSFGRNFVRCGVIAALVGGTAVVVAGPDRIGAFFTQTQEHINTAIDKHIEDPVALRAQMKKLEGEYPSRIAEVRGDLAELKEQQAQLKRELAVSDRVVSLAQGDLEQIQGLIARGEDAQNTAMASGTNNVVRVVFANQSIPLKDAYGRATHIQQVQTAYTTRANDIQRDLGYLEQQETRLTDLLGQLETEYTEFQSQMWQMDRQVDSISRNNRLIGMMEKRQGTLDEQSRYHAHSLDQLAGRFADIRAKQEARLEALGSATTTINYEDRAKYDIDARKPFEAKDKEDSKALHVAPTVIEITPDSPQGTHREPTGPTPPVAPSGKPLALKK
jgi:predicted RNase H-like nuclease (RuvC/YqgF family)